MKEGGSQFREEDGRGRRRSGKPTDFIPLARPWMDEREAEAARRPIMSGWVTQGPEVAAFEEEFAACMGSDHACAVSNCTAALHLALLAVGVRPGDEVITVSHSFLATSNAVSYCGAVPVFVDIEPETFNMSPALIEGVMTSSTRAILCVHQMGMPCNLEAILEIAHKYGLPVVEDCACAVGSEIRWDGEWQKIGKPHGEVACFSFHPRKVLSTGDGGMLTTSNAEWDHQFRLRRSHGMSVSSTARHKADKVLFESYDTLGFNYRMTDIQAAIGRDQLKRLQEIFARRRLLAQRYNRLLKGIPGVIPPVEPIWARSNWQSYCVRLPSVCDQRQVMQKMLDAGIATRRGVMCSHREPVYAQEPWSCGNSREECGCSANHCLRLAESEQAQDHCILLPLFPQLTEDEQDYVAAVLREAIGSEIAEAFP